MHVEGSLSLYAWSRREWCFKRRSISKRGLTRKFDLASFLAGFPNFRDEDRDADR